METAHFVRSVPLHSSTALGCLEVLEPQPDRTFRRRVCRSVSAGAAAGNAAFRSYPAASRVDYRLVRDDIRHAA